MLLFGVKDVIIIIVFQVVYMKLRGINMVFSSYEFIFLFLPVVIIIYYLLANTNKMIYQHLFLVLASMFFYGYFNMYYLGIIIASILVNYLLARMMDRYEKKKLFLIIGILFNIGLLGYFKYYDFFVSNVNAVFGTSFMLKHILLPLGISFLPSSSSHFWFLFTKKKKRLASL